MGGVLKLTSYPIRPSRLIAMVTVSWLISMQTLFVAGRAAILAASRFLPPGWQCSDGGTP